MERNHFTRRGTMNARAELIEMLGSVEISTLTPAHIRAWHKCLCMHVGDYTAKVAKKFLRTALCLAAEDFGFPHPQMPTRFGRPHPKAHKKILTPDQVGILLSAATVDEYRGIYYAFPFLTGVRPSEQLALRWADVDLERNIIHIRRAQLPNGKASELTKTSASVRDIPISGLLKNIMTRWRPMCPTGIEDRVFPCSSRPGHRACRTAGRPLCYTNFIYSYWRPALATLGLPIVTPHSARHSFISTLQAQGIEVGLVAKLAGHASATVTLSHYTHAVRGGEAAIQALELAYANPSAISSPDTRCMSTSSPLP